MQALTRSGIAFSLSFVAFLALGAIAEMIPPPTFEHNMETKPAAVKCEVCQAVIFEASKRLRATTVGKKGRQLEISGVLDKVCGVESFRNYAFAPPSMIKTCHDFVGAFSDQLESAFLKGQDYDKIQADVCMGKRGWCKSQGLWNAEAWAKIRGETPAAKRSPTDSAPTQPAAEESDFDNGNDGSEL